MMFIYGYMASYLTILCILSSATTKMKNALSLLCLIACFVLQSYLKVQYAIQNSDFFSWEGNI